MSKKEDFLRKVDEKYRTYRGYKTELDQRIIDNQRWYKGEHWKQQQAKKEQGMLNPVTNFIFSAIANKHADAMDYYPMPNIVANDEIFKEEAERLSDIVPCVLERCNFEEVYSRTWYDKLIDGTGVYGVFYNKNLNSGIGDIDVCRVDLRNMYWESGVEDIQDSPYLFCTTWFDKGRLCELYPKFKGEISQLAGADCNSKSDFDSVNTDVYKDKVLVIDCYYKKDTGNGVTLQMIKYTGNVVLVWTEEDEELKATGLYHHGLYPFVFDDLYPVKGQPNGMGLIDLTKNQQEHINKLDQIIVKNANLASKKKKVVSEQAQINKEELLDGETDVVVAQGSIDETRLREFSTDLLGEAVANYREQKEQELKEVIGNRDFSTGGSTGGVTAMGAITALQEAGEKLSRDANFMSYAHYKRIIYMVIELIRQFYDEARSFRIEGKDGYEYISYDNSGIKPGFEDVTVVGQVVGQRYKKAEFDVTVTTQKNNPYNRIKQNTTIMQLWGGGFFSPDNLDMSLLVMEHLSFDGKDELIKSLKEYRDNMMAQAQMPTVSGGNVNADVASMLADEEVSGDMTADENMQNELIDGNY